MESPKGKRPVKIDVKMLIDFARAHDTTMECARAIFEIGGPDDAERLWSDPTREEFIAILRRAFLLLPPEKRIEAIGSSQIDW